MYDYRTQRAELFTESGMETVLAVRSTVERHLSEAGAVRAQEAMRRAQGDSWTALAALDYLVERGEIREVTNGSVAGQHRVFVSGRGSA